MKFRCIETMTARIALGPGVTALCMLAAVASLACRAADPAPGLDAETLAQFDFYSTAERDRVAHLINLGVLEISRVVAADAQNRAQSHMGWPVATQLPGGRVLVAYKQTLGHGTEDGTRHVVYSDDLVTWLPAAQPNATSRISDAEGMHCIGWALAPDTGRPRAILVNGRQTLYPEQPNNRVFVSNDDGVTWTQQPMPFANMLASAVHSGPNLIQHPEFGLVAAFGQQTGSGGRNYLVRSLDAGLNWEERVWVNSKTARSVEPTLATWGPGHMVMIAREYNADFGKAPDGTFCATQHVYRHTPGAPFSSVTFTTDRSNIAGNGAVGYGAHDTAEVIYNPQGRRI
jgi:hypothetical protein